MHPLVCTFAGHVTASFGTEPQNEP